MGLFSFIGWIISSAFDLVFELVANVFVWIVPSYMTVQVIKNEKKTEKYGRNYMCFWIIMALLWALEYTVFYLFCSWTFYRIVRLMAVVMLQIDHCGNAAAAFTLVKPLISREHEEKLAQILDSVTSEIDKHGGKIKEKASNQFWAIIQQNYELIKDGAFNAMTTVSQKAGKMASSPKNGESNKESAPESQEQEAVQKKES